MSEDDSSLHEVLSTEGSFLSASDVTADSIDVVGKGLASISSLSLKNVRVKQVFASRNRFSRLAVFLPIKASVQHLDVSLNRLQCCAQLNCFRSLTYLNLADNQIDKMPVLDQLLGLVELNLSRNCLVELPCVGALSALSSLFLDGNPVSSLAKTAKCLPRSLISLALRQTSVRDLTEFSYLSALAALQELHIEENPCVRTDGRAFDYRPYLSSCCQELRVVDGFVLSESELLKGEWLFSQGKRFRPGEHDRLVEFLTDASPLVGVAAPGRLSTQLDERIERLVNMRHVDGNKENSPRPVTATQRAAKLVGAAPPPPPPLTPRQLFADADVTSPPATCEPTRRPAEAAVFAPRPVSPPLTRADDRSVAAAVRVQSWWRGVFARRHSPAVVAATGELRAHRAEAVAACAFDRLRLREGAQTRNEQLNTALCQLTERLSAELREVRQRCDAAESRHSALEARCERLTELVQSVLPAPSDLTIESRAADGASVVICWRNTARPASLVIGNRLLVNDEFCGQISAKQLRAIITDLDPASNNTVQVQACFHGDIFSPLSPPLCLAAQSDNASEQQ